MPAPAKPKKTTRNKPGAFDEMIITLPAPVRLPRVSKTPATQTAAPAHVAGRGISDTAAQRLIIALWIGAVMAGGIGVGRLIAEHNQPVSFEAPVPVATAGVSVAAIPTADILFAPVTSVDQLAVAPALSVDQAQAGNSFDTMSVTALQGADTANAVHPGFAFNTAAIQGTVGTTPIR